MESNMPLMEKPSRVILFHYNIKEGVKMAKGFFDLKDCKADIARATVRFCPLGEGDVAP